MDKRFNCFTSLSIATAEECGEDPELELKEVKYHFWLFNYPSILKENSPEYSLEGLMLKLKTQYVGHPTHWKRPWCWERLKAGGEGDDRGWGGWMASPTWWIWVWVNSGSGDGQGGLACFSPRGRRVGHDWATTLNWTTLYLIWIVNTIYIIECTALCLKNLYNCALTSKGCNHFRSCLRGCSWVKNLNQAQIKCPISFLDWLINFSSTLSLWR